jgi:hypothetical protein
MAEMTARELFGRYTIELDGSDGSLVFVACEECGKRIGTWFDGISVTTLMDAMADHFTSVHA